MASVPPCSFLRAYGSKNGGSEATATVLALSNSKSMDYVLFPSQSGNEVSGQSRPQEALAPFENETSVTSAVIVATANDRAVTAKERSRSPIGTCHKKGDAIGHRLFGRLFPASVCRDRSFAVTALSLATLG